MDRFRYKFPACSVISPTRPALSHQQFLFLFEGWATNDEEEIHKWPCMLVVKLYSSCTQVVLGRQTDLPDMSTDHAWHTTKSLKGDQLRFGWWKIFNALIHGSDKLWGWLTGVFVAQEKLRLLSVNRGKIWLCTVGVLQVHEVSLDNGAR